MPKSPIASRGSSTSSNSFSGFCVAKDDLRRWQWQEHAASGADDLKPEQILVGVAKFAFSANNVTYARMGDQIAYWRFFPAPPGWGYIPVWGIGNVVQSRHPEMREGERIYGYLPMASHLVLQPGPARGLRFADMTEHRRELPPVYNEYYLIDRDAGYDRAHENEHLVLRPLFSLSFFCVEFLKEERFFGARQVIISSASSKTSLGLAFLLANLKPKEIEVVGLTSSRNAAFVAGRGVYDRVVTYDALSSLPGDAGVFIDVAGDAGVRSAVHHRLGDALKHSALVGFTHWDAPLVAQPDLPGPQPKLFFTPDHVLKRRKEWGADQLKVRLADAWQGFLRDVSGWLVIEEARGREAVERVYAQVRDGRTAPDRAHVLSI